MEKCLSQIGGGGGGGGKGRHREAFRMTPSNIMSCWKKGRESCGLSSEGESKVHEIRLQEAAKTRPQRHVCPMRELNRPQRQWEHWKVLRKGMT